MLILWGLLFSSLFLTNYDFKKYQMLRTNYGYIYDDSLDKLNQLENNSLAVLLILSFVLVLLLTGLMFFYLYITYKDDIALLCLNHIQFFKANGFFILASLLANISFKLLGLLIGYLVMRYYDLIILGLPFVLNVFPLETGIPIILISIVLDGIFCILAFIVPFKGKAFLDQIKRIQR